MPTCTHDVLLNEVSDAFARLATLDLPPLLDVLLKEGMELQGAQLVRHLLLLEWRSRDVLKEFAEFYCVRLLLDDESPLATYFIDLFSQLTLMLHRLKGIYNSSGQPHPLSLDELYRSVSPASHTCRLLYGAYRMLPKSGTLQGLDEQRREGTEFKREGRHGRKFSRNEFHCRIRELGFVNLDKQGNILVSLREQLGEGGFGKVYRGVFETYDENGRLRTIVGDPVAVKMFSNGKSNNTKFGSNFGSQLLQIMELISQPQCIDRLSLELHRLVSVRHPNIVTPRGYIGKRLQGESGLVMELMDESLHDYLEKVNRGGVPPLQELDMLDLMLEIAKGMRFMHECNLIHRDLKPTNVLLRFCRDREDLRCKLLEVKLADFGLTKLCDFAPDGSKMYMQTTFLGTACYMAPELRDDAPVQESLDQIEKLDVFSYGTTCFNILIGNPDALTFSSSVRVFYEAVKTGEWKQWVQGIDKHLHYFVKLVARCWESEPARRPTFAALCVLLQHAMQCLLVSARFTEFAASDFRILHTVKKAFKLQYSHVYGSVIMNCLCGAVGGVRLIMKCFLDFNSIISAKPRNRFLQMTPKEVARRIFRFIIHKKGSVSDGPETSDFAQDVSIFLEAMRKRHFRVIEHAKDPQPLYLCEYMDSCLDNLDPLLFIKGRACYNLAAMYDNNIKETHSLLSIYEEYGFDFKSDGAFCELEVDKSLVPLLLSFLANMMKPFI